MSETNPQLARPEVLLPTEVSLDDLFWIDPASFGTVGDMINGAHLSTMALGVESRREEHVEDQTRLKSALIAEQDPLSNEQYRALDVGFLYGQILGEPMDGEVKRPEISLPGEFVEKLAHAKDGLDLTTDNGNYNYFMRLRDLEVDFTGSDVLAFSLAATQDHMRKLFVTNHKGSDGLTSSDIIHMQSLYYAGALAGAILAAGQELPRGEVQIMRGRRASMEPVSARLEFDSGDNLESTIEYQLSSKYGFTQVVGPKGRRAVAITPGGLQYGPNALSLPMYIPGISETPTTSIIESKHIDALLVETESDQAPSGKSIKVVKDLPKDEPVDGKIVGVISNNHLVSAYDRAHPISPDIDELIGQEMEVNASDIVHSTDEELWQELNISGPRLRGGKWALGAAAVSSWAPDVIGKIINPNHEVKWGEGIAVTLAILGIGALIKGKKNIIKNGDRIVREFDEALQDYLDAKTLHGPRNLGTLSASNEEND